MERVNFSHLFYFYVTSKEGSIKAAAERLHVSQPTISDQIKLLEEFLNCSLFERKHRSLYLTQEGKLAQEYSEKIFDLSNDLVARLRNKIKLPKNSLEIGMTPFMSQYFLYKKILPFFEQKNISVNFQENERHLLLADLEEGNLDIVFTNTTDSISHSMASYRIGVNRTFAVAHKKFKKHQKTFPESLNHIPFFSYTNSSTLKYEIELFFSKNGISPQILGQADDIDLFQLVTEKGLAFTVVPEIAKNRLCLNKDIIILGELQELQTSVWGIIKKNDRGVGFEFLSQKTKLRT